MPGYSTKTTFLLAWRCFHCEFLGICQAFLWIFISLEAWKQQIIGSVKLEEEEPEDGEDPEMSGLWCDAIISDFWWRETCDEEATPLKPKDYILFVLGRFLKCEDRWDRWDRWDRDWGLFFGCNPAHMSKVCHSISSFPLFAHLLCGLVLISAYEIYVSSHGWTVSLRNCEQSWRWLPALRCCTLYGSSPTCLIFRSVKPGKPCGMKGLNVGCLGSLAPRSSVKWCQVVTALISDLASLFGCCAGTSLVDESIDSPKNFSGFSQMAVGAFGKPTTTTLQVFQMRPPRLQ